MSKTSQATLPAPFGQAVPRLVRLPVIERYTMIRTPGLFGSSKTLMEIGGVGILVHHTFGTRPTEQEVCNHLTGERRIHNFYVEAETAREAVEKFLRDFPAAQKTVAYPALRIDERGDRQIEVLPQCDKMHYSKDGNVTCGHVEPDGVNGEYGMCVIEGYDPPGFPCPVDDFRNKK